MPEKEPQYFKEFRKEMKETFATKADLKSMESKFANKSDLDLHRKETNATLELLRNDMRQHTTDLKEFFEETVKGIGEYVKSIDEKVTTLDHKVTVMQGDVFQIKAILKTKADEKDLLKLKRRVLHLEAKNA